MKQYFNIDGHALSEKENANLNKDVETHLRDHDYIIDKCESSLPKFSGDPEALAGIDYTIKMLKYSKSLLLSVDCVMLVMTCFEHFQQMAKGVITYCKPKA